MHAKTLELTYEKKEEELYVTNITMDVSEAVRNSGMAEGAVTIFVVGSTASVSTMEYDPGLVTDLGAALERFTPSGIEYEHGQKWGDDNGKGHIRSTIVGPSLTIPFKERELILGTWQQIVLLDFDTPKRKRRVVLSLSGE